MSASKVLHLRGPPGSPAASPARSPAERPRSAAPSPSHARNASFTRTFVAAPSTLRSFPDPARLARALQDSRRPSEPPPPASPSYAALLGGGVSEADGGALPAFDRRALSPRFARAAEDESRERTLQAAGMPTHGGTTQSFGWSADAARPVVRRGASEQTQSTWIEECGDDLDGPIRPPPPIVASSTRPKNLGMQRPAFVERAQEEGYAGYHGEAVGGTVSELIHGAASSPPPPPQLGAASPGTPRSRLSAPAWAERMHGRPSALAGPDGDGAGAAQRGGERSYSFVRTDVPDDPHERALRREAAAVRAIEMYSGRGAPAGGARAAAHAQLASPSASPGSARALVRGASEGSGAGSPRRALQPYAPAVSPGHGASDGPFALAAALAHARIPDMRRGIAVPTSRMVLSREPDPAWSARRPLDSFADLGDGLAASEPAGSYDPLPRRARSPGKAESAIRNLGAIEPPPPVHSPSRRGGGSSAQRQRNGSAAIAGALHDASDLAQQWAAALHGALPADPAQVPPISPRRAPTERRGRATTPPRDERQSVAYALGIDGHSLRQAASQPPPPPAWSPARASKTSYEPGEMFALLQQDEYPPTLRARSPRAGSEHWRSPRAGRETGGIPVSPRARAWR